MSSWNEQAAAEWAAHGVFHGRITPEEWDLGGVWLLGDRWPDGYPGKTSKFCYKSWCSRPEEKYRNYPPKNHVMDGQWEFVQVLDGCLECVVEEDGDIKQFPLERGKWVDIRPEPLRHWRFAEGKPAFASGIAFFRRLGAPPIRPGAGEGYEFRLWRKHQIDRLVDPLNLPSWSVKFVEVLPGSGAGLWGEVITLRGIVRTYVLGGGNYLFLHHGVKVNWPRMEGDPSGIVVYLQ